MRAKESFLRVYVMFFFFSSRRRHTRFDCDWSSDVCSSDLVMARVERYAKEIVPAFNAYFYFRIGTWISRRVARLLYRVRLGFSDEAGLAAVASHSTVVFLMNHRSNKIGRAHV